MALHYTLVVLNGATQTDAANQIADLISRNERTVREWSYSFIEHECSFPDSQLGKYQREEVLWHNEDLNKSASQFVRENAVVKGKPNLTAAIFFAAG